MSGSVSVILLIPRYLMIMGFALLAIYFFKVDGGLEQMTAVHTDFETCAGGAGGFVTGRIAVGIHVYIRFYGECGTGLCGE